MTRVLGGKIGVLYGLRREEFFNKEFVKKTCKAHFPDIFQELLRNDIILFLKSLGGGSGGVESLSLVKYAEVIKNKTNVFGVGKGSVPTSIYLKGVCGYSNQDSLFIAWCMEGWIPSI